MVIVRGLPGSGKSTFAKARYPEAVHCEADMFFELGGEYRFDPKRLNQAHAWCQGRAIQALQDGRDVVVSNTFVKVWELTPYVEMAERFGAEIVPS